MIVVQLQKVGKFLPRFKSMSKYWIDLAKVMDVDFSQDKGKIQISFSRHDGDGTFSQKIK